MELFYGSTYLEDALLRVTCAGTDGLPVAELRKAYLPQDEQSTALPDFIIAELAKHPELTFAGDTVTASEAAFKRLLGIGPAHNTDRMDGSSLEFLTHVARSGPWGITLVDLCAQTQSSVEKLNATLSFLHSNGFVWKGMVAMPEPGKSTKRSNLVKLKRFGRREPLRAPLRYVLDDDEKMRLADTIVATMVRQGVQAVSIRRMNQSGVIGGTKFDKAALREFLRNFKGDAPLRVESRRVAVAGGGAERRMALKRDEEDDEEDDAEEEPPAAEHSPALVGERLCYVRTGKAWRAEESALEDLPNVIASGEGVAAPFEVSNLGAVAVAARACGARGSTWSTLEHHTGFYKKRLQRPAVAKALFDGANGFGLRGFQEQRNRSTFLRIVPSEFVGAPAQSSAEEESGVGATMRKSSKSARREQLVLELLERRRVVESMEVRRCIADAEAAMGHREICDGRTVHRLLKALGDRNQLRIVIIQLPGSDRAASARAYAHPSVENGSAAMAAFVQRLSQTTVEERAKTLKREEQSAHPHRAAPQDAPADGATLTELQEKRGVLKELGFEAGGMRRLRALHLHLLQTAVAQHRGDIDGAERFFPAEDAGDLERRCSECFAETVEHTRGRVCPYCASTFPPAASAAPGAVPPEEESSSGAAAPEELSIDLRRSVLRMPMSVVFRTLGIWGSRERLWALLKDGALDGVDATIAGNVRRAAYSEQTLQTLNDTDELGAARVGDADAVLDRARQDCSRLAALGLARLDGGALHLRLRARPPCAPRDGAPPPAFAFRRVRDVHAFWAYLRFVCKQRAPPAAVRWAFARDAVPALSRALKESFPSVDSSALWHNCLHVARLKRKAPSAEPRRKRRRAARAAAPAAPAASGVRKEYVRHMRLLVRARAARAAFEEAVQARGEGGGAALEELRGAMQAAERELLAFREQLMRLNVEALRLERAGRVGFAERGLLRAAAEEGGAMEAARAMEDISRFERARRAARRQPLRPADEWSHELGILNVPEHLALASASDAALARDVLRSARRMCVAHAKVFALLCSPSFSLEERGLAEALKVDATAADECFQRLKRQRWIVGDAFARSIMKVRMWSAALKPVFGDDAASHMVGILRKPRREWVLSPQFWANAGYGAGALLSAQQSKQRASPPGTKEMLRDMIDSGVRPGIFEAAAAAAKAPEAYWRPEQDSAAAAMPLLVADVAAARIDLSARAAADAGPADKAPDGDILTDCLDAVSLCVRGFSHESPAPRNLPHALPSAPRGIKAEPPRLDAADAVAELLAAAGDAGVDLRSLPAMLSARGVAPPPADALHRHLVRECGLRRAVIASVGPQLRAVRRECAGELLAEPKGGEPFVVRAFLTLDGEVNRVGVHALRQLLSAAVNQPGVPVQLAMDSVLGLWGAEQQMLLTALAAAGCVDVEDDEGNAAACHAGALLFDEDDHLLPTVDCFERLHLAVDFLERKPFG